MGPRSGLEFDWDSVAGRSRVVGRVFRGRDDRGRKNAQTPGTHELRESVGLLEIDYTKRCHVWTNDYFALDIPFLGAVAVSTDMNPLASL